jgi:biopolymer transport protein ExbB
MNSLYAMLGPAGVALILVACLSLYLSLKNFLYLYFVRRDFNRNFRDIERQSGERLHEVCARCANPLISIVHDVVTIHAEHSKDIRAEVAYLFHRNFEPVMKGLCYLRLIAVISPLLGLLGTVLGMVTVFKTIAANTVPNPALLAAGIWEALATTILGLSIAIPTLMAYYFLMLQFKGFHIDAVEFSYRAIELCTAGKDPDSRAHGGGFTGRGRGHV